MVKGLEHPSSLGDGVFKSSGLQGQIQLSPDMQDLPTDTFRGCTGLTGVQFPSGLKSIGYGSFYSCTQISDIVLPRKLEYIGFQAFYHNNVKGTKLTNSSAKSGHTYTYKVRAIAKKSAANSSYSYYDTIKVK